MAKRVTASKSETLDLQELITGAAQLQLTAFNAGVEYWKALVDQTAKLTDIASDTLEEIRGDKGSVSNTTRRLVELGKQNAEVFGELSTRLSKSYLDELTKLTGLRKKKGGRTTPAKKAPARETPAKRTPAKARAKKAARRSASGATRKVSSTRKRTANR